MKKLIGPVFGAAVVIGGLAFWMNRPYPDWKERTVAEAGLEGATIALSIVGRDGAEEEGVLWVTCGGAAGPTVALGLSRVQFVGPGSVTDGATLNASAHFGEDSSPGGEAPVEIWVMPAGKGMFSPPDPKWFIRRLADHGWVSISPGGRGVVFHVRRLGQFRERVWSQCELEGATPAPPPYMPPAG